MAKLLTVYTPTNIVVLNRHKNNKAEDIHPGIIFALIFIIIIMVIFILNRRRYG
jgi:hypothetical protein